jgi:hypothetical protein
MLEWQESSLHCYVSKQTNIVSRDKVHVWITADFDKIAVDHNDYVMCERNIMVLQNKGTVNTL